MQPAKLANQLMAGTQKQMIGVAENDARIERFEHLLRQRLDRAARADWHKHRCLYVAARSIDAPDARVSGWVSVCNLEECGRCLRGQSVTFSFLCWISWLPHPDIRS